MEFSDWDQWIVPVVMLLLVYTAFKEPVQELIDGMATWVGEQTQFDAMEFKPVAFGIIILLVLIMGVSLAIYLHGAEPVNFKSVGARMGVILILFAAGWLIQMQQSVFSISAIP
jgi:hypothetical protein